jgi:hypothetical protein
MSQDLMSVFHPHFESRVGKAVHDHTFHDHGIRGGRGSRRSIIYFCVDPFLLSRTKFLGDDDLLGEMKGAIPVGKCPRKRNLVYPNGLPVAKSGRRSRYKDLILKKLNDDSTASAPEMNRWD